MLIVDMRSKKLGARVFSINKDQFEDFSSGQIMDKTKTGNFVSRDDIVKKLKQLLSLL